MENEVSLLFNLGRLVGLLQGKGVLSQEEFAFAKEVLTNVQETLKEDIIQSKCEVDV